jgi:hypothetical protein
MVFATPISNKNAMAAVVVPFAQRHHYQRRKPNEVGVQKQVL